MPHEYRDDEDRAPPFNENLVSEQGVDASGGYSAPIPANQTLAGYRSTAVRVNGNGSDVEVELGWTHSGDAGGFVTLERKTVLAADAGTVFFVNQGDELDHVTLTGGANVDYSVNESNQLPLPPADAPAFAHFYSLGGEPGIVNPVTFVGSDLNVSPNYQALETWQINTNDPTTFAVDPSTKGALVKKQGVYLCLAQFNQSDRPLPPFGTGVPIAGLLNFGFTDGLGGGTSPGAGGPAHFPMAQTHLDGSNRDLGTGMLLNAFVYHEVASGLDFLPLLVQLYYAPAVATTVVVSNWTFNIVRLTDGSIDYFF